MTDVKQIVPKNELIKAKAWFSKNRGGWKDYLKQRGLMNIKYFNTTRSEKNENNKDTRF